MKNGKPEVERKKRKGKRKYPILGNEYLSAPTRYLLYDLAHVKQVFFQIHGNPRHVPEIVGYRRVGEVHTREGTVRENVIVQKGVFFREDGIGSGARAEGVIVEDVHGEALGEVLVRIREGIPRDEIPLPRLATLGRRIRPAEIIEGVREVCPVTQEEKPIHDVPELVDENAEHLIIAGDTRHEGECIPRYLPPRRYPLRVKLDKEGRDTACPHGDECHGLADHILARGRDI